MKKLFVLCLGILFLSMAFGCDPPNNGNGCNAPDSACREMTPFNWTGVGSPPSGPYDVVIEQDPNFNTHTIYRPVGVPFKIPIVVWGNGGCSRNGTLFAEFLSEIASHGFLIVSDGSPEGSGVRLDSLQSPNGTALIEALDWVFDQNDRACSPLYQKLDITNVAAMGQSCGGLMTYGASADPRLTTIVIWNSGLFERDQQIYNGLHTPMAFFIGGSSDVAYPNADADFNALEKDLPIFYGNLAVGHMATYSQDNGGEFGRVGVAWLKYQLMDDQGPEGAQMFEGSNCGLCNTDWVVKKKNMP